MTKRNSTSTRKLAAKAVEVQQMTAHEFVVGAIQRALEPEGGEVRLVGRVNHPAIGNGSNRPVYFFVPDLHLVSPAARRRYSYGFNHEAAGVLARILTQMAALRKQWKEDGLHDLVTVQLGDFLDLWREGNRNMPFEAHEGLRDLLYRGPRLTPMKDYLNATLILGNHDTLGGQVLDGTSFVLKAFNRTSGADKPFLFVTHGDAFDWLEKTLPDAVQEFAVYYLGPAHQAETRPLSYWAELAEQFNTRATAMRDTIQGSLHSLEMQGVRGAVSVVVGEESKLPDILAQRVVVPTDAKHDFFAPLYESLGLAGNDSFTSDVRVGVIGHTHHARMVFCQPSGGARPLVLMDCGAWIENCSYQFGGATVEEESAQIGVIHGNDARLYQIHVNKK